jgi:hypothetical protein
VPEPDREKLMVIRRGEMTLDEAVSWSYAIEERLKRARDKSSLTAHPHRESLGNWLYRTYLAQWSRGDLEDRRRIYAL